MTLMELSRTLPIGFHDGKIGKISIDYMKMEADFEVRVWVGDLHSKVDEVREEYRFGNLKLTGLQFLVIEAPDTTHNFAAPRRIDVDMYDIEPNDKVELPEPKDPNAFVTMIYVGSWNKCIYVSALNAEIKWLDPD